MEVPLASAEAIVEPGATGCLWEGDLTVALPPAAVTLRAGAPFGISGVCFSEDGTADRTRAAISSSTVLRLDFTSAPSSRRRASRSLTFRFISLASCPTRTFAI